MDGNAGASPDGLLVRLDGGMHYHWGNIEQLAIITSPLPSLLQQPSLAQMSWTFRHRRPVHTRFRLQPLLDRMATVSNRRKGRMKSSVLTLCPDAVIVEAFEKRLAMGNGLHQQIKVYAQHCNILMLLRCIRQAFSKEYKLSNTVHGIDSNLEAILSEREKMRRDILRKESETLPMQQSIRSFYDSIVNITYYMRNDCWKSQYLYLMLNYNKLGFRRVSDLVHLDRASYLLDLRQIDDGERWPAIKVVVALEPKVTLSGIEAVSEFFRQNGYFIQEVQRQGGEVEALQAHIDQHVVPALESLFWHPKLTYQYSFHTNLSSYQDTSRNYNIFGILRRNTTLILSRIGKNLVSIAREPQRYAKSKETFTNAIKELQRLYLKRAPFFGGERPSHVDFYLMAQLRTRGGCSLFMNYLQSGIGGQFWSWWIRVSNLCQYNPDRITTL